ncbi:hypothetical protein GCM10007112_14000 [Vulcanisaeta souniana JCM 11219]|uniref:Uncharacterized protein n=1 Tax=Vulcanisaeta souniana JCM 11219 TaxID=1293586 RepID=A0A830EFP7_9CREN|nr:hypothetical protein GCM10007112_14000 [Vulcanisaeta souniana JCM 11219]
MCRHNNINILINAVVIPNDIAHAPNKFGGKYLKDPLPAAAPSTAGLIRKFLRALRKRVKRPQNRE